MIEKLEKTVLVNGEVKKLIVFKEKLPEELKWIKQVKMLENKGYIIKYIYDGKEYDIPKGEIDSKSKSFIPKLPDRIKVLKYEPGEGLVEVTEFEGRSSIDPEPEVAMRIWELFGI